MFDYTFNKNSKGIIGCAFELAIKEALGKKAEVSPAGQSDFTFNRKHYDSKQNGSILQYAPNAKYIKGSSRVIYATHIAHKVLAEDAATITIHVDLGATELFVVDKVDFVNFLLNTKGMSKYNKEREQVNIQTVYNYSKDAYHGKKGYALEEWCAENMLDDADDILDAILTAYFENNC